MSGKTLYDKIWDAHLVTQREDGTALIYIDRHLIHEVTSPQAFEGLRIAGRKPWRADANFATPDHNIPTTSAERRAGIDGILDPISKIQVTTLDDNCNEFGILEMNMDDIRQGIVHVVGPEQGATLPGMTMSVVIRIPRHMAHSARLRMALAPRRSNMSWRHSA